MEPEYEIWGLDNTPSDMDGGTGRHREDCLNIDAARARLPFWQTDGRAAWIQDKNTGETVN